MKEPTDTVEQDETNDGDTSHLPVDRGWAWVILAASWMNQFLVNGQYRTFGILFPEIQRKFGTSAATTSLISALNLIAFGISTILVQTIGLRYFSTRQVVMVGAVTMCMAYAVSAFSPVVELLMLFQGILNGFATGLVFAPTNCLLGEYFNKRRGMAICLSYTGAGLGLFAFSFLAIICLEEYGFTGAMLMVGAACFHSLIAGALQRPMSYYSRRINKYSTTSRGNNLRNENNDDSVLENGSLTKRDIDKKLASPLLRKQFTRPHIRTTKRLRSYSQDSRGSMVLKVTPTGGFWRYSSSEFGSSVVGIYSLSDDTETRDVPRNKPSLFKRLKTCLLVITSIDVIKRPAFFGVLFSGCLIVVGSGLSLVFLAPHAKDLGLSNQQASILLTVISITDMASVPVWGIIVDKNWLNSKTVAALACTVIGAITYFMPLYTSFNTMIFFSLMFGLFGRVWISLYSIVMVDMFGLDNMKSALGILVPSQTLTNSCFLYVMGAMRDALGSYIPGFQLIATFFTAGAIGLLSLRLVETCGKARGTQKHIVKEIEP